MKVFVFFWIKAVIALIFALLLLLLPMTAASWFGVEVSPDGSMIVQMLGVLLLGIALICTFAGFNESTLSVRNTMVSLAITDTLGFLILLLGQINGVMNSYGLLLVVLWALLALAAWLYWVIGGRMV